MNTPVKSSIEVAAVQLWSDLERSPAANRHHALEMLSLAASTSPDLVVMPEAVSMLCYPDGRPDFTYRDVSEPIPGPTSEEAALIARRWQTNVLLGLIEDRGEDLPCQNTVIAIDRQGRLIGRYDKTHEPEVCRKEQAAGRGDRLEPIEFDFGKVGVFVCWDLLAPEVPAILALKGARLLCFPHMISLPSARNFAVTLRARAIDNALPVVAAGMRDVHNHRGSQEGIFPTCVIDANGEIIGQTEAAGPDIVQVRVPLGPVRVDHLGLAESDVNWSDHRLRELRPDLYARHYGSIAASKAKGGGEP
jgi:predicted amidohydrolase